MKVTSKKIAELANVSRGTVDRVLNNRPGVNPQTRERVEEIIKALDYHPNLIGKSLVKINSIETFGFILTPDYNPFVWQITNGIKKAEEELKEFGVHTDIRMLRSLDIDEQDQLIDEMISNKVSGIAMIPLMSEKIVNKVDSLGKKGFPIITFNSQINSKYQLCFVGQDHYKGGVCAANLMGRLIRTTKDIGVIISSKYLDCHINRFQGFQDRLNVRYRNLSICMTLENQDRDDLAFSGTLDLIERNKNIGGIYITGGGISGVANAIEYLKRKDIRLICHDYNADTRRYFDSKVLDFAIGQNPEMTGALLLHLLFDYKNKSKIKIPKIIDIPLEIATEDILDTSQSEIYSNYRSTMVNKIYNR